MSKKKSFSGSTMKLKDFHGGSIPSDLPLPSAPGGSASPSNRVAYDRPLNGAWGMGGRMDHHQRPSRPGSAGGSGDSRGFVDDSVPFLPSNAHIGRNFEEDERKPFDTSSAPRRAATIDPDPLRLRQTCVVDPKQPQPQAALGRPGSSPAAVPYHQSEEQGLPAAWNSSPAPSFSGSAGSGPAPTAPNAWGTRKDTINEPHQRIPSTLSGPAAVAASAARFAQASAIEKISSGRWQSKPSYSGQTAAADFFGSPTTDAENARSDESNSAFDLVFSDQRHNDRINASDSGHVGYADGRHSYDHERVRSPGKMEVLERNVTFGFDYGARRPKSSEMRYPNPVNFPSDERIGVLSDNSQEGRLGIVSVNQIEGRVSALHIGHQEQRSNFPPVRDQDEQLNGTGKVHFDDMSGGSHAHKQVPSEAPERPKLRLLPRTKPVEPSERLILGGEQGYKTSSEDCVRDTVSEPHANQAEHFYQRDSDDQGQKGTNQFVERPRLNLKPRSLPLEQPAQNDEKIRNSVFGGARPRELVLKDRGIEIDSNDVGLNQPANRYSKLEGAKLDKKPETAVSPRRPGEKGDNYSTGRRLGTDRKDFKTDHDKIDVRRSYQKNDQRQNTRENEKLQGGRSEPERWRKPVEEPKPEVSRPSYGKMASAVQLAQVFSKSISDAHQGSRLISPKGIIPQAPFSRLTDSREIYTGANPRKINGF